MTADVKKVFFDLQECGFEFVAPVRMPPMSRRHSSKISVNHLL